MKRYNSRKPNSLLLYLFLVVIIVLSPQLATATVAFPTETAIPFSIYYLLSCLPQRVEVIILFVSLVGVIVVVAVHVFLILNGVVGLFVMAIVCI